MIEFSKLVYCVIMLFLMIIPGFCMQKFSLIPQQFPKGLANLILYVAQPGMIIYAFITEFDKSILLNSLWILVFSFISIGGYYLISLLFFKNAPEQFRKVLRYSIVFSNAGYMGMPLIISLFSPAAAIYVSVYIISFNLYSWSLGCLIYTDDKKYISLKKIVINPAVISIAIGVLLFFTNGVHYVPNIIVDGLLMLKELVAPLSMMFVGIKLAQINFRGITKDKYIYLNMLLRLILLPSLTWAFMRAVSFAGLPMGDIVIPVVLVCSATPAATATCMFAEKFNCDSVYASKIVSVSTVLSLITMPLVSLLLYI